MERAKDWEELRRAFSWSLPADLNMATQTCLGWARREPDRTAIFDWNNGEMARFTHGWVEERSRRLANALSGLGIEKGDRVALLLPQCPQVVVIHMALYRMGAVALPMALLFGPQAIEYRLKTSGARAVITNAEGLEKLAAMDGELPSLDAVICLDGAVGQVHGFEKLLADAEASFDDVATTPDTPALMIFTSGTTGPPKAALHGHRVLTGHLPGLIALHEFTPQSGDLYWTPADWAWAGGLLNVLMPGLALGIPVVCNAATRFNPEEACHLMGRAKVRNTFIPPTALKMMKSVEDPRRRFGVDLRTVFSGGEALGRETLEWGREALGVTINEGYGQTECNIVLTSCAAMGVSRPGSMGKPAPGHDVAVIREDGTICDAGEQGQIAIRRPDPVMFLHYWDQPEATADKFINDWLKTGDQAVMDEDGYFFFVGRDDDIITSAGFRIGPGEIEDCLIGHPAVRLAAAVGKPDPVRTEIVKCYVQLKDGIAGDDALRADIATYVRQHLSAHEYPREIEFVDAMPLTTTGKVIRREFRDRARRETAGST